MGKYIKLFNNHSEYTTFTGTDEFIRPNVSHCIQENEVHYNPYYLPMIVTYIVTDDTQDTLLYNYYNGSWAHQYGSDMFIKAVIDDEEVQISSLDDNAGKYHLSAGTHTVKYFLVDNDNINGDTFDGTIWSGGLMLFDDITTITKIIIPRGIKRIGGDSLRGMDNIAEVVVPDTVESFGFTCLGYCTNLTSVNIPDGVKAIGTNALSKAKFQTITLPSSIISIEDRAFISCSNLTSITILAQTPPTLGNNVFDYTNDCPIYVPSSSVIAYQAANGWSTYASRIQAIP